MAIQPRLDTCHDLAYLPRDIFWLLLGYLDPVDLIRCRRVSHAWNEAFSNPAILVPSLKRRYPWTREAQALEWDDKDPRSPTVYDQVVARYDHLQRGKPRSVQKYRLCDDFGSSGDREWFQVQPWELHASHMRQVVDRQFSEALWTYEDGLLVYPSADHQCLVLMDLSSDRQFMVPFIVRGKVVRRVRIQMRLLVVEWAEPKAFHWLNDSDGVHRHFASSFDVKSDDRGGWRIVPRNEWKIMFLGHPLSERDRFFSAHSNTHYVIYIWQPNRSLYTADEDAPIESLFVWDISNPSSYRPSLDPTCQQSGPNVDQAPSIVSRFGFRDLDFFDIRQRGLPALQRLGITDDGYAVRFTEMTCFGDEDVMTPFGYPHTVTTVIPMQGYGPHQRRVESNLPAYRGTHNLHTPNLRDDEFLPEAWFGMLSELTNESTGVAISLHFDPINWTQNQRIYLTFETRDGSVSRENLDFTGRGLICGGEYYLVGENCNRELVIWRFDR
ncbi:hypothetical protein N7523_003527 [Penicillium sp. IBT 18751x]|nr:hypothetical protein N7523_003527 [Penicillium sp. IBT 18751x]